MEIGELKGIKYNKKYPNLHYQSKLGHTYGSRVYHFTIFYIVE
jgi:hypothetical protein